ncbi:MAG TPA: ABC transporter permease, partial [Blastocatellia bacterium]|nr:ABC transporter permease [Blastocatellia bacterium]
GDTKIIGRTIRLGGDTYTIVGVMPEGFFFPSQVSQIWTPLAFTRNQLDHRGSHMFFVVGRMKPDVTLSQALSQMKGVARQIELQYPAEQTGRSVRITPLKDDMVLRSKPALLVLLGAVAAVLLICCVNVASLMLTNAASRRRETAVRAALGADRWRLIRQFMTESVVLSIAGGALGAVVAKPALGSLIALASTFLPRSKEVALDFRVLAFTLAISILTGIAFGIAPAFHASRTDVRDALTDGTRSVAGGGSHRLRQGLVISEIALSLALLIGAGLLIKSFNRLQQVKSGINPDNVVTMQLSLPANRYTSDEAKIAFFKQVLARIEAAPGVESAGTINLLPMQEWGYNGDFGIEGLPPAGPGREPTAEWRAVSPDYFRTLGIPLLEGRVFGEQDGPKTGDVVVINQALAERYLPGEDPVGKHLILGDSQVRIVGMVGDVRQSGLAQPALPTLFLSCDQSPLTDGSDTVSLAVRGKLDASQLVSIVRGQILAVDRAQPVYNEKPMSQVIADSSSDARLNTLLLAVFAGLALVLAAVGVYGVISYYYAERTREIGIRMALGALPSSVRLMALRQGATLAAAGVGIGLGLAFALTRTLSSLLYSVKAIDPEAYAAMVGLLLAITLVACYVPARRASKVDPISALRWE